MRHAKRGDLSVNIIIVAIIALLVLVIMTVLFSGRMAQWGQQLNSCEDVQGKCDQGFECLEGYTKLPGKYCYDADNKKDPNNICCIKIEEGAEEFA